MSNTLSDYVAELEEQDPFPEAPGTLENLGAATGGAASDVFSHPATTAALGAGALYSMAATGGLGAPFSAALTGLAGRSATRRAIRQQAVSRTPLQQLAQSDRYRMTRNPQLDRRINQITSNALSAERRALNRAHSEGRVLTRRELDALADSHEETLRAAVTRHGGEVRLPSGRSDVFPGTGPIAGRNRSIDMSTGMGRPSTGLRTGVDTEGRLISMSPTGTMTPLGLADDAILAESAALGGRAQSNIGRSRLVGQVDRTPNLHGLLAGSALVSGGFSAGFEGRQEDSTGLRGLPRQRRSTGGQHFSGQGELRDAMRSMDRRIQRKRRRGGVLSDAERLAEVNPREVSRILREYGTFTSVESAAEIAESLLAAGMEISDPDAVGEMVIPSNTRNYLRRLFQRQQAGISGPATPSPVQRRNR